MTPLLAGHGAILRARPRRRGPDSFTYYPGTGNIGAGMIPPIYNRSFTITADLEIRPPAPRV